VRSRSATRHSSVLGSLVPPQASAAQKSWVMTIRCDQALAPDVRWVGSRWPTVFAGILPETSARARGGIEAYVEASARRRAREHVRAHTRIAKRLSGATRRFVCAPSVHAVRSRTRVAAVRSYRQRGAPSCGGRRSACSCSGTCSVCTRRAVVAEPPSRGSAAVAVGARHHNGPHRVRSTPRDMGS